MLDAERAKSQTGWWGYAQAAPAPSKPVEPISNSQLERLREKREPSLGEVNPLIFPPNLLDQQSVDALRFVIDEKIKQYGGLEPSLLSTVVVPNDKEPFSRIITRFEVGSLEGYQVVLLESLVAQTYTSSVRTRKDTSGNSLQPTAYHPLESSKTVKRGRRGAFGSGFMGWYMGPDITPTKVTHTGLFVYRDIGDSKVADYLRGLNPKDWFFDLKLQTPLRRKLKNHYVVEIREHSLYPTDLVQLIAQVSSILGRGEPINSPDLLYDIYNDLNRLGLRRAQRPSIYGSDEAIAEIVKSLIIPLANLRLSSGIELRPGSVLLTGVPGTGKTLIAEYLLQQDLGVFLVPLVPKQLSDDLSKTPESRTILPRISQIFRQTGMPVVIHLDDVESLGTDDKQINSTLLNLMAGVREHGFFIIASTNNPEALSKQLLQPERFATIIHFGLHEQEARKGILNIHATSVSRELGRPLFRSLAERDLILEALSRDGNTKGFTPRFLAEICTQAKINLLERISEQKQQKKGLSEEDIEDNIFTLEDWARALGTVSREYNKEETEEWDRKIREFVSKHRRRVGFTPRTADGSSQTFLKTYQELKPR